MVPTVVLALGLMSLVIDLVLPSALLPSLVMVPVLTLVLEPLQSWSSRLLSTTRPSRQRCMSALRSRWSDGCAARLEDGAASPLGVAPAT